MSGRRCRRCLLPAAVPGAELDAQGCCAWCRGRTDEGHEEAQRMRVAYEADLEASLERARGQGPYDAIVCLSGGKDSLYLLHELVVERQHRILAFTCDVNLPDVAQRSIRRTVDKLGVDHVVSRPPRSFYRKLFRYLLRNQEPRGAVYTVSYVYAPLFEGEALRLAVEKKIPLVLAGYSPGQPEPERMVYEYARRLVCQTDWTPPALRDCDELDASDLARFWNPARFPAGTEFPRYLAPLHAWPYDQGFIMRRVAELGLVERALHASPVFSNYPINWLLMYSDLKNFGYNPYYPEFSALIRNGKASRNYWRVMGPVVDFMIRRRLALGREVTRHMQWLDLEADDLRITQPLGAYDPPQCSDTHAAVRGVA